MEKRYSLEVYEKKITSSNLSGEKLARAIESASFKHTVSDLLPWLESNSFFKDHLSVIDGIKESNKWSILTNELQDKLLNDSRILEAAYCYKVRKKSIPTGFIKSLELELYDLCSLISLNLYWQSSGRILFPSYLLKYIRKEFEFSINKSNIRVGKGFRTTSERDLLGEALTNLILNGRKKKYKNSIQGQIIDELSKQALNELSNSFLDLNSLDGLFLATTIRIKIDKHSTEEHKKLSEWNKSYIECIDEIIGNYGGRTSVTVSQVNRYFHTSDINLIVKLENKALSSSYVVAIFNILLLRLFKNGKLDFTYSQIENVPLFEKHLYRLCEIGVLQSPEMSEVFKWPALKKVSAINFSDYDFFEGFNYQSPLKYFGYTVGRFGLSQGTREELLADFYSGKIIGAENFVKKYDSTWGDPLTAKRLERMARHLVYQIANKEKLGHLEAVEDWTSDYFYLKEKYYDSNKSFVMKFTFPSIES